MSQCPKCYRVMTLMEECGFCGHRAALASVRNVRPDLLLADLDWIIHEIERGDQTAWTGDDFIRLEGALRRAHEYVKANAKAQFRSEAT